MDTDTDVAACWGQQVHMLNAVADPENTFGRVGVSFCK